MKKEQPEPVTSPRNEDHLAGPEPAVEKSRYAIPLSTLIAGAYVAVTEHVQLQPTAPPHDWAADIDSGGGDGDSD